jgi:PHD/YefM family antitoxin component YafN of YafNO toxin-antitoxin module
MKRPSEARQKLEEVKRKLEREREEMRDITQEEWDAIPDEEKWDKIKDILNDGAVAAVAQQQSMKEKTSGRASDLIDGPIEWAKSVDVCKSERLRWHLSVALAFIASVIGTGSLFAGAVYAWANNLWWIAGIGTCMFAFALWKTLWLGIHISKAAYLLGYLIATVDTSIPLIKMMDGDETMEKIATIMQQVAVGCISEKEYKRLMAGIDLQVIPKQMLTKLGRSTSEIYANIVSQEPKFIIIK